MQISLSMIDSIDWLSVRIYENRLLIINYWTIVHFLYGLVMFLLISCSRTPKKWIWFLLSMIIFELLVSQLLLNNAFINSSIGYTSQLFDFIVGITGGILAYNILVGKAIRKKQTYLPDWVLTFFSSFSFAFLWVGSYQYQYNASFDISELNTKGLNVWAFFLWLVGGFIFLEVYKFIKNQLDHPVLKLVLSYLFYFASLLVVEVIGFHLLGIVESNPKPKDPLIFGLIHGNLALHLYYTLFPLMIILLYEITRFLQKKAHIERPAWLVSKFRTDKIQSYN